MMDTEPYPGESERWQGHIEDRARVADLINTRALDHVIWLTGDIHMNYLGHCDEVHPSLAGRMWEVCNTWGNINPLIHRLSAEQFVWTAQDPHVPLLTFDPAAGTVLLRFYDEGGALAFEETLQL